MSTHIGYVVVEHNRSTGRRDLVPVCAILYDNPIMAQLDADKERDRAAGEGKSSWMTYRVANVVIEGDAL
jgi:hypothetical protein